MIKWTLFTTISTMQHEIKFKLKILQCILTSDPITMKKNKRRPITFVINKQANKNVGSLR